MVERAQDFRLLFERYRRDYQANLQFCCTFYRSASEVCRRVKVNRQQFNRYLAGTTVPSLFNQRRIDDFFGLEEGELFMPHAEFVASFTKRRQASSELSGPEAYVGLIRNIMNQNSQNLQEYEGFYFKYFKTYLNTGRIKRELVHWRHERGGFVATSKQRYTGEDEIDHSEKFITFRGMLGAVSDRLFTLDFLRPSGREFGVTMLYPKGRVLKQLNGMTLAIGHASERPIGAARVAMEFLGVDINIRAAYAAIGTFDADDPSIPKSVRQAVMNTPRDDETLFFARLTTAST
mgnify:CR=1 FL=1